MSIHCKVPLFVIFDETRIFSTVFQNYLNIKFNEILDVLLDIFLTVHQELTIY